MTPQDILESDPVRPQLQLPFDSYDHTRHRQILSEDDEAHRSLAEDELFKQGITLDEATRRIADG